MPDPEEIEESPEERETAYELLQRGHELLSARHNAQAAVVLERAAREEPGKGSILEALARATTGIWGWASVWSGWVVSARRGPICGLPWR